MLSSLLLSSLHHPSIITSSSLYHHFIISLSSLHHPSIIPSVGMHPANARQCFSEKLKRATCSHNYAMRGIMKLRGSSIIKVTGYLHHDASDEDYNNDDDDNI
jgi:hypothetical protein